MIKVRTNTPFTIQASDFQFPPMEDDCTPLGGLIGTCHMVGFTGFGNALVGGKIQSVGFNGDTHTMYSNGDHGGWGVGTIITNPVWTVDGTRNPACYTRGAQVSMHVEINLVPPLPDGKTIPATLVADAGDLKGSASVSLSGSNVTADINVGTLSNMVYKATPTFKWKFVANTPSGLASNEFDQTSHTIYVTYADPISDGGSLTDRRLNLVCTRASGQSNILGVANSLYPLTGASGCSYAGPKAKNFAATGCAPNVQPLPDLTDNWYMYSPAEPDWDIRGACITYAELHNLELQILGISAGKPVDIIPVPDKSYCPDMVYYDVDSPEAPCSIELPFPCECGNISPPNALMQYCVNDSYNFFEGALQVTDGGTIKYYAGAANVVGTSPSQILQGIGAVEYWVWSDYIDHNIILPPCCSAPYCPTLEGPINGGTMLPPDCP